MNDLGFVFSDTRSACSRLEIFRLGQMIPEEVREAATAKVSRLAIGLSDGISKLAAHALQTAHCWQCLPRAASRRSPSAASAPVTWKDCVD